MKRIEKNGIEELLKALHRLGYRTIGPTLRDEVIVYDEIASMRDLPAGWTDVVGPGSYEIHRRDDGALFGFTPGPHSWKSYLFPPRIRLFSALRTGHGFSIEHDASENGQEEPKLAFIGARACELAAIGIHDRVFTGGEYVDPAYERVREHLFIVAVNCLHPGRNCFCASMNAGPAATSGFDLALTEIVDGEEHFFLVEVGTARGEGVLRDVPHRDAEPLEAAIAEAAVKAASGRVEKSMNTEQIKELLYENFDHAEWDNVAKRCLTCANCTMVCPTCFCSTVEDVTDLTGGHAERWRRWDSCFTVDFARVAGGNFRSSAKSRYRQWMTHKLASWIDQFGTSGCVGCGRCITWCPVGIDITEEVNTIRSTSVAKEVEHV